VCRKRLGGACCRAGRGSGKLEGHRPEERELPTANTTIVMWGGASRGSGRKVEPYICFSRDLRRRKRMIRKKEKSSNRRGGQKVMFSLQAREEGGINRHEFFGREKSAQGTEGKGASHVQKTKSR